MGCSGAEKMIAPWSAPPVAQEAQPTFTYPSTPAGFPPLSPISPLSAPPGGQVLRQQPPLQALPDSGSGQLTHIEGVTSLCWPQMVGYYEPVLQPRRRYVACTCPNCTSGANTKASNGDGSPKKKQHACHYPNCAKVYGKTSHLRAHLLSHRKATFCLSLALLCKEVHTIRRASAPPSNAHGREAICLSPVLKAFHGDHLSKHIKTHQKTRDKEQEHGVGCASSSSSAEDSPLPLDAEQAELSTSDPDSTHSPILPDTTEGEEEEEEEGCLLLPLHPSLCPEVWPLPPFLA